MRRRLSSSVCFAILFCASVRLAFGQAHAQPNAKAVEVAVRSFMQTVARDVTHDGPAAWRGFFLNSPVFYMAVDGHLVFANRAAADKGIDEAIANIKHIDLTWGNEMRIDPLTPTLAVVATPWHEVRKLKSGRADDSGFFTALVEFKDGRWQFRNLHWSQVHATAPVVKPASK